MIKIVGLIILLFFSLFAFWVMAKISVEGNYIINKKLKKAGHKGNYSEYKKLMEKKKTRELGECYEKKNMYIYDCHCYVVGC